MICLLLVATAGYDNEFEKKHDSLSLVVDVIRAELTHWVLIKNNILSHFGFQNNFSFILYIVKTLLFIKFI